MNNPIYEPKGRAREYGELAVNIYTGCNHGCVYCFARKMKERYTPKGCICTFNSPAARLGIVEAVKRQLERKGMKGRTIHLCFSCDPYPLLLDTTPTREVIKAIKDSGNHVQILTKGGIRAERDFDLLDSGDRFGVTIAGNARQTLQNEPGASAYIDRAISLYDAKKRGIRTWASFEPVFDPQTVYEAIEKADFIDFFKIGKLNYMPSEIDWKEFGETCERLCRRFNRDYYIKQDLRDEMERDKDG